MALRPQRFADRIGRANWLDRHADLFEELLSLTEDRPADEIQEIEGMIERFRSEARFFRKTAASLAEHAPPIEESD